MDGAYFYADQARTNRPTNQHVETISVSRFVLSRLHVLGCKPKCCIYEAKYMTEKGWKSDVSCAGISASTLGVLCES